MPSRPGAEPEGEFRTDGIAEESGATVERNCEISFEPIERSDAND